MAAVYRLMQADGIGIGHQPHIVDQPSLGLGFFQQLRQLVDDGHARLLVGMKGGLQIGAIAPARSPIPDDGQAPGLHRRSAGEFMPRPFGHLDLP